MIKGGREERGRESSQRTKSKKHGQKERTTASNFLTLPLEQGKRKVEEINIVTNSV